MTALGGAGEAATAGNGAGAGEGGQAGAGAGGSAAAGTSAQTSGQGAGAGNSQTAAPTGSWRDSLPEDMRGNQTLAKYSDVTNLAKAYLAAQEMIGKKGIFKPADNATPEDWQRFYEEIGVPKAEQYKLDPAKFQGIEFPQESLEWAQQAGAKHGIRPDQMHALMQDFGQFEIARDKADMEEMTKLSSDQIESLKGEWGENFDGNLKKGLVAFNHIAQLAGLKPKDAMDWLNSGAGDDYVMIKLMSAASKLIGEDTLRENGVSGGQQTMDDLARQIEDVQGQLLAMPKNDPRRQSMVDRYASLNRQKTGGR